MPTHVITRPNGSSFTVPSEWLDAAGIGGGLPAAPAYRTDDANSRLVAIDTICPPVRSQGVTLDHGGLDRGRMISVLQAMAAGVALPPLPVAAAGHGRFQFRLLDGFHRYHAALILDLAGVPVIDGWVPEVDALPVAITAPSSTISTDVKPRTC